MRVKEERGEIGEGKKEERERGGKERDVEGGREGEGGKKGGRKGRRDGGREVKRGTKPTFRYMYPHLLATDSQ